MQASSSARASTRTITSWRTWRLFTSSLRCWIASLGMCVSLIWCLIFIRCVDFCLNREGKMYRGADGEEKGG
jgi:hypothetical protein